MGQCYGRARSPNGRVRQQPGNGTSPAPSGLRCFTYKELKKATRNFKEENLLGAGSFGRVYKATLDDWTGELPVGQKRILAVKVLSDDSFQGLSEWMSEVLILSRLQHPCLVRLLGYSNDRDAAMLAYEFLEGGSLDTWLFAEGGPPRGLLTWPQRVQIALDATAGLAFLHAQNIIHRDFKSCNILLTKDLRAKLTDFGMATTGPESGHTHVSTRVMGTMGYLDPKYLDTGHLTPKSDVYALGVVFLELLTGKPPADDEAEESRLTAKMRPHFAARRPDLPVIMDPRLEGKYSRAAAHKLLVLAKHCVNEDPLGRPQIMDLLKTIQQIAKGEEGGGEDRVQRRGFKSASVGGGEERRERRIHRDGGSSGRLELSSSGRSSSSSGLAALDRLGSSGQSRGRESGREEGRCEREQGEVQGSSTPQHE